MDVNLKINVTITMRCQNMQEHNVFIQFLKLIGILTVEENYFMLRMIKDIIVLQFFMKMVKSIDK